MELITRTVKEMRTGKFVLKVMDRATGELQCMHCGKLVWGKPKTSYFMPGCFAGKGKFVPGTFTKCPHCGIRANTIYEV